MRESSSARLLAERTATYDMSKKGSAAPSNADMTLWNRAVDHRSAMLSKRGQLMDSSFSCLRPLIELGANNGNGAAAASSLQEIPSISGARTGISARPPEHKDFTNWSQFEGAFNKGKKAYEDLVSGASDLPGLVNRGLDKGGTNRVMAFQIADSFAPERLKQLFDGLVPLAVTSSGDALVARKLLMKIPKDWLREKLKAKEPGLLSNSSEETYRSLLEIYSGLDRTLADDLARRAIIHPDSNIQEVGRDYLSP